MPSKHSNQAADFPQKAEELVHGFGGEQVHIIRAQKTRNSKVVYLQEEIGADSSNGVFE